MIEFFNDNIILKTATAQFLYEYVGDLPIVDYHCHLSAKDIYDNVRFTDIGDLWLKADHYKWRAMRLLGVDEKYITGDASSQEKFFAFAEIMPKLFGNPVYYWTHLELKKIFGITKPLNGENARCIWDACNEKLKDMSVSVILNDFKVKYIATTDDPVDDLKYHGKIGGTIVAPTFRPDKAFALSDEYYQILAKFSGVKIDSAASLVAALENRLDYFISKGCKLTDHGLSRVPDVCEEDEAERIFDKRRDELTDGDRNKFAGYLLCKIAGMCRDKNICMQWHIAPLRNVNEKMYDKVGPDSGFDVIGEGIDIVKLAKILNHINNSGEMPKIILYSLNSDSDKAMAALSGAFKNVRLGTAWWFNDTLEGIRRHLSTVMEYGVLGTHLGMLTDSRSFTSYVRHDFFRRILCDMIGDLVEKGEYDEHDAPKLARDICLENVKDYLDIKL